MHNLPRTHNFTSAHLTGSRASLLEREGEIEGKGKWGEELQTGALGRVNTQHLCGEDVELNRRNIVFAPKGDWQYGHTI